MTTETEKEFYLVLDSKMAKEKKQITDQKQILCTLAKMEKEFGFFYSIDDYIFDRCNRCDLSHYILNPNYDGKLIEVNIDFNEKTNTEKEIKQESIGSIIKTVAYNLIFKLQDYNADDKINQYYAMISLFWLSSFIIGCFFFNIMWLTLIILIFFSFSTKNKEDIAILGKSINNPLIFSRPTANEVYALVFLLSFFTTFILILINPTNTLISDLHKGALILLLGMFGSLGIIQSLPIYLKYKIIKISIFNFSGFLMTTVPDYLKKDDKTSPLYVDKKEFVPIKEFYSDFSHLNLRKIFDEIFIIKEGIKELNNYFAISEWIDSVTLIFNTIFLTILYLILWNNKIKIAPIFFLDDDELYVTGIPILAMFITSFFLFITRIVIGFTTNKEITRVTQEMVLIREVLNLIVIAPHCLVFEANKVANSKSLIFKKDNVFYIGDSVDENANVVPKANSGLTVNRIVLTEENLLKSNSEAQNEISHLVTAISKALLEEIKEYDKISYDSFVEKIKSITLKFIDQISLVADQYEELADEATLTFLGFKITPQLIKRTAIVVLPSLGSVIYSKISG